MECFYKKRFLLKAPSVRSLFTFHISMSSSGRSRLQIEADLSLPKVCWSIEIHRWTLCEGISPEMHLFYCSSFVDWHLNGTLTKYCFKNCKWFFKSRYHRCMISLSILCCLLKTFWNDLLILTLKLSRWMIQCLLHIFYILHLLSSTSCLFFRSSRLEMFCK